MSSIEITEMLLKAFLRFLIPGVVFIIFVFLLPSYLLIYLFQDESQIYTMKFLTASLNFIDKPILCILLSISIGILLDLSRFHSFWTTIIFMDDKSLWFALKIAIVNAAGIEVRNNNDKEYKKKIMELAYQIHSVFIRAKHPQTDQKIENIRTYPDILSMSLTSAITGTVLSIFSLSYKILTYPEGEDFVLFILLIAVLCIVFFLGKDRVRSEFDKLNELTNSLIKDAFSESSIKNKKDKKAFFEILEKKGLIKNNAGKWQIV